MRRTLVLLGVAILIAMTCTTALAANRGVTFNPIGFIDDPGPLPASLVIGMSADGSMLLTSPTPYGNYTTMTDPNTLEWTLVGGVFGHMSGDGSTIMASAPDGLGVDQMVTWEGMENAFTYHPAPDGFAPCGSSGHSIHGISYTGAYATGLTWQGCSYARGSKFDRATNTSIDLGSPDGDSTRGNEMTADGATIAGWTTQMNGARIGATWEEGNWSWISPNGAEQPLSCVQSGGGCTWNGDCPEFVDDGYCDNAGACDQSGIECDKAGIECDQAGIECDLAGITCDKTGVACVDGTCNSGPNAGMECDGDWNCAGTCSGGVNEGNACSYNSHCPGTCTAGPAAGQNCTSNYNCPGTCTAGPSAGLNCTSSSNCPGTCTGGSNAGGSCNYLSNCPGACASGPNAGQACSYDSACPGNCGGGPAEGDACTGDYQCPDTPACDDNPNWVAEDWKGEAYDITPDGDYIVGEHFGQSAAAWNEPGYNPELFASAYRMNPDGSFTQIGIPPFGNPEDAWTPFAISDDGSTVVGRYGWWIYSYPTLWTEATGTLDLQYFLIGQGLDDLWFWYLTDLTSVSADGKIVAGHGYNPDGWLEGYTIDLSKVSVCHKDGTPAQRTLRIGWDSIADHLAHGDDLATCEFLASGARSRSVDEFRPTRPANATMPEEAKDSKWHSGEDVKKQAELSANSGSEQSSPYEAAAPDAAPEARERATVQRSGVRTRR